MRRVCSEKQAEKWKRKLDRYREIQRQIREAAPDILHSGNFYSTKKHIQHGNMTVNDHVMDVARYSIAISDKLHIPCKRKDLIRGALLHDYFLYDWHKPDMQEPHKLHGFYHPWQSIEKCQPGVQADGTGKRNYKKAYVAFDSGSAYLPGGVDCYCCG